MGAPTAPEHVLGHFLRVDVASILENTDSQIQDKNLGEHRLEEVDVVSVPLVLLDIAIRTCFVSKLHNGAVCQATLHPDISNKSAYTDNYSRFGIFKRYLVRP